MVSFYLGQNQKNREKVEVILYDRFSMLVLPSYLIKELVRDDTLSIKYFSILWIRF